MAVWHQAILELNHFVPYRGWGQTETQNHRDSVGDLELGGLLNKPGPCKRIHNSHLWRREGAGQVTVADLSSSLQEEFGWYENFATIPKPTTLPAAFETLQYT